MSYRFATARPRFTAAGLALLVSLLLGGDWIARSYGEAAQGAAIAAQAVHAEVVTPAEEEASQGDAQALLEAPPRQKRPKPQEEARRSYLGRVLAEPMSHLGASWLVRPERELEEDASRALEQLQLQVGMKVCDLGCGNGYWTLPISRAVGPGGRVYAVDIQPEMLQQLKARLGRARLRNVEPILGDVDDPRLPADVAMDLVLMVDVYHEFSHPQTMLWAIRNSLAPEGVVALLEYREEDPLVPIKPLHKMSKRQIMREYQENGFKLVREFNDLPWQHLMFFARDDSPLAEIQPLPFSVD
jgi:ubiquinone/menaquinone biosynthesis C-methylase UbiE